MAWVLVIAGSVGGSKGDKNQLKNISFDVTFRV